jgi:hypothetical protein
MQNNGSFIVLVKFTVTFISLMSKEAEKISPFIIRASLYNLHFPYKCHMVDLSAREP